MQTEDDKWRTRVEGLLENTIDTFFSRGALYEVACEPRMSCTTDMLAFKGFVHRWLSTMTQIAPFTAERTLPVLRNSTEAAIAQCTGGDDGRTCGFQWTSGKFDGSVGAGQTMNVMSAVSALLVGSAKAPVTNSTGGTSQGNPDAGSSSKDVNQEFAPVTTADRAGAGIITFLLIASAISTFTYMSWGDG